MIFSFVEGTTSVSFCWMVAAFIVSWFVITIASSTSSGDLNSHVNKVANDEFIRHECDSVVCALASNSCSSDLFHGKRGRVVRSGRIGPYQCKIEFCASGFGVGVNFGDQTS